MTQQTEFPLPGLPRPEPDADSRPYWDGLADGKLLAPQCRECTRLYFPATPTCPHCGNRDREWQELRGTPVVYSWIVVHRATHPDIPVPYTVVLADFPEGVRMPGNMAGDESATLAAGTPLVPRVATRDGVHVVVYRHA